LFAEATGSPGRRKPVTHARNGPAKAGPERFPWLFTKNTSPGLRVIPIVDVLANLVLRDAVALLDLAFELIAAAVDDVEIIVGELAPLLLDLAFDLLPVSFDAIPVHRDLQVKRCVRNITSARGTGSAPRRMRQKVQERLRRQRSTGARALAAQHRPGAF